MHNGSTYTCPYAGDFVPLTRQEQSALRDSICEFGISMPVIADENDNIIDGVQRLKIANDLGIICEVRVVRGLDVDQKRELAIELNPHRGYLSPEDVQEARDVLNTRLKFDSQRRQLEKRIKQHQDECRRRAKNNGEPAPPVSAYNRLAQQPTPEPGTSHNQAWVTEDGERRKPLRELYEMIARLERIDPLHPEHLPVTTGEIISLLEQVLEYLVHT
jgi:hypothetical protein